MLKACNLNKKYIFPIQQHDTADVIVITTLLFDELFPFLTLDN